MLTSLSQRMISSRYAARPAGHSSNAGSWPVNSSVRNDLIPRSSLSPTLQVAPVSAIRADQSVANRGTEREQGTRPSGQSGRSSPARVADRPAQVPVLAPPAAPPRASLATSTQPALARQRGRLRLQSRRRAWLAAERRSGRRCSCPRPAAARAARHPPAWERAHGSPGSSCRRALHSADQRRDDSRRQAGYPAAGCPNKPMHLPSPRSAPHHMVSQTACVLKAYSAITATSTSSSSSPAPRREPASGAAPAPSSATATRI